MQQWIMDEWKALEHGTVSHQHKKRRALSPRHMRTMSVGNNDGEMQGEGWSFLLWQASKQPAGWIAVIGVKCPQLAVHWQSCAARSSILSLRRSCRRRGAGTGVRLSRVTHVALTLAAVWRMSGSSLTKSIAISSLGPHAGQEGVIWLQMVEREKHLFNGAF